MHLLEVVASPAQRKDYLAPLAQAHWRSCFAMTEPPPGAGSDPGQLNTQARRDGDHYIIEGRKWLITGAEQAGMAILMARAFDGSRELGPTMFLTHLPQAGVRIVRLIDSMDSSFSGGHAELALEGLRVHQSQILGEVGQGLKYAQVRLAPARLTHCMRWLGSAVRAQEIALTYANTRTAFGQRLLEHGSLAQMLARNEIDIHACRQLILHTAWLLDQGKSARHESSMVKAFVSETLFQVADRCLQLLGGLGVTRDTQVERIFREIRAFRIYDGPTEVHHWAIARRLQSQHATHGSAA
jgi:acyl-CoA dehydrogenase